MCTTTDNKYLIIGSWEGTIALWDIEEAMELASINLHGHIHDVLLTDADRTVAALVQQNGDQNLMMMKINNL